MERLPNCAKSIFTPQRQLFLHNIATLGLAFGMAQEGFRANSEDNDPTVLYLAIGTAVSSTGGLLAQSTFSEWVNTQQFLTSLSNVLLSIAETCVSHGHHLPKLMDFAWINLALGWSGFSVQAAREFGCISFTEETRDGSEPSIKIEAESGLPEDDPWASTAQSDSQSSDSELPYT